MLKSKSRNQALAYGIIAALAAGSASPVFAAEGMLEEVIVTAQKREQSASDVGIAISVLGGDAMADRGILRSEDIVKAMPNIELTAIFGPGTNPNYSIRGVTQNDYNDATESPIAMYVDDVYLVVTGAGSFPLFDMNRVEVLRGPQGTLFGRNSTGGAIHFISNEPSAEFSSSVAAAYGSHNRMRLTGHVNGALSERVQVRLSGYYQDQNGYYHHRTGAQPDAGAIESKAFRGQIALEPIESVRNVLKISYARASGYSTSIWRDAIAQDPVTGDLYPIPGNDSAGVGPVKGLDQNNNTFRALKEAESQSFINKFEWKVSDNTTVTSITGYNHYLRDVVEDCDGGELWLCSTHYRNPSRQYSEELRAFVDMGRQRYTFGAYYLNQKQTINQIAPLFVDFGGGGIVLDVDGKQRSKGYAVFANGEFDLGNRVTLIAGLRGAQDKKHINHRYAIGLPVNPADPWPTYVDSPNVPVSGYVGDFRFDDATAGGLNSFSKKSWNGKLELDFKPSEGNLIYASVSRGTKAPGYNHGFISGGLPNDLYLYDEEKLTAFEAGFKSSFLDNRARLDLSAYYYDYKNYDVLNYIGVGSLIDNADATAYGAELEFSIKPTENWFFSLNASASDHEIKNQPNSLGVREDRDMPIAPKWTASAMVRYEHPVGDSLLFGIQLDGRTRAHFYNNPDNDSAARVAGYAVANGRIYVGERDGRWEASLAVDNIFDRRFEKSIFMLYGISQMRYGFYGEPRWVTGEIKFNF